MTLFNKGAVNAAVISHQTSLSLFLAIPFCFSFCFKTL